MKILERILDWVAPMEKLESYVCAVNSDQDIEDLNELLWQILNLARDLNNDASIMLSQPMQRHVKQLLGYKIARLYLTYVEQENKK